MAMPTHDKRRLETVGHRPRSIALNTLSNLGRLGHNICQAIPLPFITFASFVDNSGRKSDPWLNREMEIAERQTGEILGTFTEE